MSSLRGLQTPVTAATVAVEATAIPTPVPNESNPMKLLLLLVPTHRLRQLLVLLEQLWPHQRKRWAEEEEEEESAPK